MSDVAFDIDAMIAAAREAMDLGRNIPIGVRLHPADFKALVRECTAPPNPSAADLPVYLDDSVPRGEPKFMYREAARKERGE